MSIVAVGYMARISSPVTPMDKSIIEMGAMMAGSIVSDDGEWMWTGSEWIPTPPNAAGSSNEVPENNQIEVEELSKTDILGGLIGLIILLGVIVSIGSSSSPEKNETYIQWTNVDDCLFQVELVASEGLVYRETVDSYDRVSWEGLEQTATRPYVFTISNLESSGPDCFTHQRLFSNGDFLSEYFSLGPGEESILTLY